MMKPKALVFIFNKNAGDLDDVSAKIVPFFAPMVKNLVSEKYINSKDEFDVIADKQRVYFIRGDDEKFKELLMDDAKDRIADVARTAYYTNNTAEKDSDTSKDVNAIIYDGSKAPWGFDLILTVIYENE